MPLEAGTLIPDLDANNPLGGDPKSEGDDHLRLIKRCTQGSFPAFVGTTAVPKSVSLTEDEINDAAQKSADAVISGNWQFQADIRFDNSVIMGWRDNADAADITGMFLNSSDILVIGQDTILDRIENRALTDHLWFAAGQNSSFSVVAREFGGGLVRDRTNSFRKCGFRNPQIISVSTSRTITQDDEGQVLRVTGTATALTIEALEEGTTIRVLIGGAANGANLIEGATGITLRQLDGSDSSAPTGNFNVGKSSVIELFWRATNSCDMWGNGLSQ